jgi:hypothetical protein
VTGFLLHLGVGALVAVSGLIMPAWAVMVLAGLWFVALILAIRWRRRPAFVLLVPFAMIVIWLTTAWVGETFWGWTA